jgi:hypothetical protein
LPFGTALALGRRPGGNAGTTELPGGTTVKTPRIAALLAALTFSIAGCQPNTTTTTAPATQPSRDREKDTNIHIQGPRGGKVDVHSDGNNGGTNVDVRKGTRR